MPNRSRVSRPVFFENPSTVERVLSQGAEKLLLPVGQTSAGGSAWHGSDLGYGRPLFLDDVRVSGGNLADDPARFEMEITGARPLSHITQCDSPEVTVQSTLN